MNVDETVARFIHAIRWGDFYAQDRAAGELRLLLQELASLRAERACEPPTSDDPANSAPAPSPHPSLPNPTCPSCAASEERAARAERERDEAACALDEFAPHHTGLSLAESIAELRTRLCVVRAEIEAKGGWRDRLAASESERRRACEALRQIDVQARDRRVPALTLDAVLMIARRALAAPGEPQPIDLTSEASVPCGPAPTQDKATGCDGDGSHQPDCAGWEDCECFPSPRDELAAQVTAWADRYLVGKGYANAELYRILAARSPGEATPAPTPPGPPSSPDRCKCGAVSLWRNASPNARAYDGLTRIWHTRAKCEPAAAPPAKEPGPEEKKGDRGAKG